MRVLFMLLSGTGCAYISDKHEAWRLDPDEDGVTIVDDCNDDDGSVGAPSKWYVDKDEDGYGDPDDSTYRCQQPEGHVAVGGDCDDTDASRYPGAEEICDNKDNNCDEADLIDEGLSRQPWYADDDGDGFGNPEDSLDACGAQEGRVDNADDCDDSDATWLSEGPVEIPYNGIDDNCDAADGDGDRDLDGYWASDYYAIVVAAGATPMDVHPDVSGDCDDTDGSIWPGAFENWYDGIDSDCDGRNDCDRDGDGYESAQGVCTPDEADCNDLIDTVNPGADELCSTPDDDDCDGSFEAEGGPDCTDFYLDFDGDGYGSDDTRCGCTPSFPYSALVSGDCNDADATISPGEFDAAYDGVDSDCGGEDDYDFDGDDYVPSMFEGMVTAGVPGSGSLAGGDCLDSDDSVHPGATEDCSTPIDDNCDGETNEWMAIDCTWFMKDADSDGFGDDDDSECWCEPVPTHSAIDGGDCVDSDPGINPYAADFNPGAADVWYDGEDTNCGYDDDFDADADGYTDEGYDFAYESVSDIFPLELRTFWYTDEGLEPVDTATDSRIGGGDCDDSEAAVYPGAVEVCDGLDNDCNDAVDDEAIDPSIWYEDFDEDGYGDPIVWLETCSEPGFVLDDTDCDDGEGETYPGALDYCGDGIDADCSGDESDCTDAEPESIIESLSCMDDATVLSEVDAVVSGEHISVSYGPTGNWRNDAEGAGLMIKPEADGTFVEAVYGGSVWDYAVVDGFPFGAYTIGHPLGTTDDVHCSKTVRVGDVIGAVHTVRVEWTIDSEPIAGEELRDDTAVVYLTKKELWNETGKSMLVEYSIVPNATAGALDLTLQRAIDFDIDAAPGADGDTWFYRSGATVMSSGPSDGASVGIGSCSPEGLVGSDLSPIGDIVIADDVCDPDGYLLDGATIVEAQFEGVSAGSPGLHRFVLTVGDSATSAATEWDAVAETMCGTEWFDGGSESYPGGVCDASAPEPGPDDPAL